MTTESKFFIGIGVLTIIAVIAGVILLGNHKPKSQSPQTLGTASQNDLIANAPYTLGNPSAPVQLVEFADMQCPACQSAQPIVEKILEENKEKVYFVFRHYPLSVHKNAKLAAQAVEAAGAQGKFFEMTHVIYANQEEWANKPNPREDFRKYAQELSLDINRFNKDMEDLKENINNDFALGERVGVNSTPTFFINGQKYSGVIQQGQFQQIIDSQIGKSTPESTQSPQ